MICVLCGKDDEELRNELVPNAAGSYSHLSCMAKGQEEANKWIYENIGRFGEKIKDEAKEEGEETKEGETEEEEGKREEENKKEEKSEIDKLKEKEKDEFDRVKEKEIFDDNVGIDRGIESFKNSGVI